MSKSVSTGYTDTAIDGVSSLTFSRGLVNFDADFRVKSNSPGKEVVLTNLTCPVDRPERFRISYSEIANIYSGSGVDASLLAPTKRGVSVLVQLTEILSVSESTDADYRIDLPVSYHLVIKVPANENITSAMIMTGLGRLLSGLFDTGVETTSRLDAILRGSLVPSGL